jgi:hypothetical protein
MRTYQLLDLMVDVLPNCKPGDRDLKLCVPVSAAPPAPPEPRRPRPKPLAPLDELAFLRKELRSLTEPRH